MNAKRDTIKNKAILLFDVLGKSHTIESNEVEAKKIELSIYKEQSCNIVFEGDKICYRIIICNKSCIDLFDLDFKDRLENDIHYERNSFKVNGTCKNPTISGQNICYHINELKAHEEIVISFEVEVE